jgi:DNA-binding response OmpR family regulator
VASKTKPERVLCVAQSFPSLEMLEAAIRESGYSLLLAFTTDHAVAACVNGKFAAVILDAELVRGEGEALAEALKLIRPKLPVLLLEHREDPTRGAVLPKGVDAAVIGRSPAAVVGGLKALLGKNRTAGTGPIK